MKKLLDRTWTRYAAVALVTAMVVVPTTAFAGHDFSDVPNTHLFHNDIAWMLDNGITFGCGSTKYCPEDNVTRGQMAAFMRRLATKKVVDANTALTAGHATTADSATHATNLGRQSPAYYESVAAANHSNWFAQGNINLSTVPVPVAETTIAAPAAGFLVLAASATFSGQNARAFPAMWVEIDDGSCLWSFFQPTNSIPGAYSFAEQPDAFDDTALSIDTVTAVTAGSHKLTLCGALNSGGGSSSQSALVALWVSQGTVTADIVGTASVSSSPTE